MFDKSIEFMSHIIAEIAEHAIENGEEPDDTIRTVAQNLLCLLEIATCNHWESEREEKEEGL